MPWLQLTFDTHEAVVEQLSECLTLAGANAVTLQDAADQPLFEPPPGTTPLWQHTQVMGLFTADTDIQRVIKQLQVSLGETSLPAWKANPLEDKDWVRAWMDGFKPMRFGQHLWVCPSNFIPPEPQATNIILDPGLAFGTGTHPTTAMCLEWLDAHPPQGKTVIDFGCGSGILALAAAKLGASQVWAVDNDPQALQATQDNADKNSVSEKITICPPEQLPMQQVDIILANILAGPLQALAEQFAELLQPGGELVLSGILAEQSPATCAAYGKWCPLAPFKQREDWMCLHGTKQEHSPL